MYDSFICYRGSSSAGEQIAAELYEKMQQKENDIGSTYYSPKNDRKEIRNFLLDPDKIFHEVKCVILILTKDFFSNFIIENKKNENSVTCLELTEALKNKTIEFFPIVFPDFLWQNTKNDISNQSILEQLYGVEQSKRIIGAPPYPFINKYKEAVFNSIIEDLSRHKKDNTKAVVFDFDGTLTKTRANFANIWERLWISLGYPVSECEKYHKEFSNKKITHDEWCEITERYFKQKSLSKDIFKKISLDVELLKNIRETIKHLHSKGIYLYILSGSIKQFIEYVLGEELVACFEEIKANRFVFNEDGTLEGIIGTPYDFEGKARFVNKIISEKFLKPSQILYIGNSFNDEFVYTTGVETLCINPQLTDFYNDKVWHNYIRNVESLEEILKYVKE